jgi:hypothetical protein
MTRVILVEGLEDTGRRAFAHCTSFHKILIPPAVKLI